MTAYHVNLWLLCPERPTYEDFAFLGPRQAKVDRRLNDVRVDLDLDARDLSEAVARAEAIVLEGIKGDVVGAWVRRKEFAFWPTR